ncbi:21661_t:CDS:2, partial [Gigaspora rosea]
NKPSEKISQSQEHSNKAPKEAPRLIPLAPRAIINKHNPTLYCVHPLLGNVASYVHLSRHLGITRPVYGIQAPNDVESDIPSMAERYIKVIQDEQPSGTYLLCGCSCGGLYLIDAPSPLMNRVRPPLSAHNEPHKIWESDIEQLLTD